MYLIYYKNHRQYWSSTLQHILIPLDLTVKFGLSVQIEPNVTMEFTPDTSLNSSNFTVRYVNDGPNPDTIQLGLYNTSYTLIGSALGIAFEGVSSS